MKSISYNFISFLYLAILGDALWAMNGENTYIFAASACPPWKTKQLVKHLRNISSACKNDAHLFTSKVKMALDVPSDNIMTVVDEEATYEGLNKALKKFANIAPENSRVIMYFNFHGIIFEIDTQDHSESEEVLVLWTEDRPFTILTALDLHQWITATELRQMIDRVKAEEIVITLDACHSGGAVHDILKKHGRNKDWTGREAVMTSSKSDQYSYFNIDGSYGLFTYNLSEAIGNGSSSLQDAFEKASKLTIDYFKNESNQQKCEDILKESLHKTEICSQTPIENDPSNLLQSIKLHSN